jgi:large subunit ribosomal protein L5
MLQQLYQDKIKAKLSEEFGLKNSMATPKVVKVVVNMGIGDLRDNKEAQEQMVQDLGRIVGQRPSLRRSKKSIAGFGIRQGQVVGVAATLRSERMYNFLEKLFNIVLPRIRDFRGVTRGAFDQAGNYTLGLTEQTVFPEIDLGKVNRTRGLEIVIVTSTKDREKSERLLEEMGMPFVKEGQS